MAYSLTTTARGARPVVWFNGVMAGWKEAALRRKRYTTTLRLLEQMTDRDLSDINISRLQIRDVVYEAAYGRAR